MSVIVDWNINDTIDSHQSRKSRRIRAIARVLRSKGRVDFKRFLAEMQYNGIRKKVTEEYLDVLKDLGLIAYDNNEII
jgi:predicted transcriptional regulator